MGSCNLVITKIASLEPGLVKVLFKKVNVLQNFASELTEALFS